jgi:hypothetical protein
MVVWALFLPVIIIIIISLDVPTAGAQAFLMDYTLRKRAITHHAGPVRVVVGLVFLPVIEKKTFRLILYWFTICVYCGYYEELDGNAVSVLRRTIAEAEQHWSVIGWVTKKLLSQAPPCWKAR